MSYWTLLRKDTTEVIRTNRIILVPLLFVLLSLSNVILMKMLPTLLHTATNMPKGTVIKLPAMTGQDVLHSVVGQFDQLGVLVLALIFMSSIAGERASGFLTTLLVKPVSRIAYVGSKFSVAALLTLVSFVVSMVLCTYYINLWFTPHIGLHVILVGSAIYLVKLLLVLAIVLFFSSLMTSVIAAGGLAVATTILLSVLNAGSWFREHFPSALSTFATDTFAGQSPSLLQPLLYALVFIVALLGLSVYFVSRREV